MRVDRFVPLLALATAAGCSDALLTGPEAQTAFSEAQAEYSEARPMRIQIIDGVLVFLDGDSTSTEALLELEPAMIESVQVIKGPAAIERYGSRGSEGVILITTKTGKQGT